MYPCVCVCILPLSNIYSIVYPFGFLHLSPPYNVFPLISIIFSTFSIFPISYFFKLSKLPIFLIFSHFLFSELPYFQFPWYFLSSYFSYFQFSWYFPITYRSHFPYFQFSCFFPISHFPKFQFSWHCPIFFFQVSILQIFSISTLSHIQIVPLLSSHSILQSTSIYNFPKLHLVSTSRYNFPKFSDQVLFHSNFVPATWPLNSTLSSRCPRSSIFFPLSTNPATSHPWSRTFSLQFF